MVNQAIIDLKVMVKVIVKAMVMNQVIVNLEVIVEVMIEVIIVNQRIDLIFLNFN